MDTADLSIVERVIKGLPEKLAHARTMLGRPLTYAEKILFSHIAKWPADGLSRGKSFLHFYPDRVAMQDATAQMAILQFMVTARDSVAVPTTIHCDHLIRAQVGAEKDLLRAMDENHEVYEFLRSAAARYGMGFWKPGSGIIHQVVLEQYAFPGGMMIGTDSHTPNAGGLGMIAVGVGGSDAVDVMAAQAWGLMYPKLVGVKLTGRLSGWASPKDVILKVAGMLTVQGGTGKIVEYFGEGTESISCTGKATITNMGAELGATTSLFPYDKRMAAYLRQTERAPVADLADKYAEHLRADKEVALDPSRYYDELIEIDLSSLRPQWVGPHTPDLLREVAAMKEVVPAEGIPDDIRYALIGSCTNSSYEDISRAAHIAAQAKERGLKTKIPLLVTPGSDQVFRTIERDGYMKTLMEVGATVLANACGPCIGQWSRSDIKPNERNTIITSYNRNFKKRNDGNAETLAFIGSPEIVTAMAFSGKMSFDPTKDPLTDKDGKQFVFTEPKGDELPAKGFVFSKAGFEPPKELSQRRVVSVAIAPESDRLAVLEPFAAWDGKNFEDLIVLLKAKGKCTTDHISQAGPWLKYRGHLAKISDNMFLGATNAFTEEVGKGTNVLSGEKGIPFPEIAKSYKKAGRSWIVIGDENYGEGSSREHAAMSPRFLGCKVVLVKSFARIHETNLKAQGILPLTFADPSSYDQIEAQDRIDILGLTELKPGSPITVQVRGAAGTRTFAAKHTLTAEQIAYFRAGSALNTLRPDAAKK
ncbi:MAG: aconitate hydratase [Bdellovibrionota bacterium]|nr:MAG: aconitate hydratase [Bdellovibrionota bacterium]